jgi:hypothetical protein
MLNRTGETRHPCCIPDLRRNGFRYSPLSMMLALGLSYIYLRIFALMFIKEIGL